MIVGALIIVNQLTNNQANHNQTLVNMAGLRRANAVAVNLDVQRILQSTDVAEQQVFIDDLSAIN